MTTIQEQDYQEIFGFSKTMQKHYYSCRLEKHDTNKDNLSWKCAKFYNIAEAENFRIQNQSVTVLTKIIPSQCANVFDSIENRIVQEKLNYPVEIVKLNN